MRLESQHIFMQCQKQVCDGWIKNMLPTSYFSHMLKSSQHGHYEMKKASPSFCPFLEASNISGYYQSIVTIEVAFLFQISSCIYYKAINFIGFELQTLCCWKYQACLEVALQITHINKKKIIHTQSQLKKVHCS